MNWIDIRNEEPKEKIPVLFWSSHSNAYHVGYWDIEENMMVQFPDNQEGWKWDVKKWCYIEEPNNGR